MTTDTVTWWGHATVGLEVAGVRLLTNPLLRARVAFLRWAHARVLAPEVDAFVAAPGSGRTPCPARRSSGTGDAAGPARRRR